MSFASEIKKEVSATTFSRKELYAELYAIILLNASFVISNNKLNLVFQTKQNFFARRISSLFTEVFNIKVDITLKTQSTLDKKPIYIIAISDDTQKILKEYKIINNDLLQIEKINEELLMETEEKISFLREIGRAHV